MISITNSLGRFRAALLGVLLVCLTPVSGRAEKMMFRNEIRSPIVVQMATIEKGVYRRDKPILLRYGECTEKIKSDVDRLLMIYDGRGNRMLYRKVLKANKEEAYYSITVNRAGQMQITLQKKKTMPPMTKPKQPNR
jgi:hypothetical protein